MTSHYTSDAEIERIGRGLLDRTLPRLEWTHAAHYAAALWIFRARPDIDAPREMPGIIAGYNVAAGGENTDTAGYHETITQASLRETKRFLDAHPASRPLHAIHALLMDGPLGDREWMLDYWTRARLFSVEARQGWVEPDIAPLPACRPARDRGLRPLWNARAAPGLWRESSS